MVQTKTPRKRWFVLAAMLFVGGIFINFWAVWANIGRLSYLPVEFTTPGSGTLHVDKPGKFTVYYMDYPVSGGTYRSSGDKLPEGLVITVTREDDGLSPPLTAFSGESFSTLSGSGRSLFSFEADRPGSYRISGSFEGVTGSSARLAVGNGFVGRVFFKILAMGFAGGLCFLAGIVIATITGIRWILARKSREKFVPPPLPSA